MTIGDLFHEEPGAWGLRGDPFLWRDMQNVLAGYALPDGPEKLRDLFERSFEALTGHRLDDPRQSANIAAYRRTNGGMSNGQVSLVFWRDTALPLIRRRYLRECETHGQN